MSVTRTHGSMVIIFLDIQFSNAFYIDRLQYGIEDRPLLVHAIKKYLQISKYIILQWVMTGEGRVLPAVKTGRGSVVIYNQSCIHFESFVNL